MNLGKFSQLHLGLVKSVKSVSKQIVQIMIKCSSKIVQ